MEKQKWMAKLYFLVLIATIIGASIIRVTVLAHN